MEVTRERPATRWLIMVITWAFVLTTRALAEVSLAPLFTDGAVLQRDKPVVVWGRAAPTEKVTVTFGTQRREATAGPDGRWIALLDAMPASLAGADLTVAAKNTIVLRDVVVGDVWLCSGQSNMEWPVSRSARAAQEIASAQFPLIRHIKIERTAADKPAESVKTSGWQRATPETAGAFSAVGYFFAREIHGKVGVPIGIVNASWGGTPVESWLSPVALAGNPAFRVVEERWAKTVADHPALKAQFDTALPAWTSAEAAAKAVGKPAHDAFLKKSPRPREPIAPDHPSKPASLFNGMISPLVPFSLRGMLWYQGENNVSRFPEYHALFSALITAWRTHFAQGDVPFFWVSLAGFGYPADASGVQAAFLREAQAKALALPNTAQAIAIDIGHPTDIHPTNKQEVGRRLALLARHRVYGFIGDDTGPTFASANREGAALRVRFTHANGGLIAYEKPVQSLQLAGADRVFHPAEARIDRDTLLVMSRAVREPVAVRYAWSNAPEANLYNGAGLPAVPFRSDDW